MDITFLTPLNRLGYGVTGTNITKALDSLEHDVTVVPIGPIDIEDCNEHIKQYIFGLGDRGYNPKAPQIRNFHEYDMRFLPGTGSKMGWPFFELDTISPRGVNLLNNLECTLAGAPWTVEVLKINGVTSPIEVVPQGVDVETFKPAQVRRAQSEYRFFSIGKWEARKGHPELVRAFLTAFPNEKDVKLYMMCNNPFLRSGTVEEEVRQITGGDNRVVLVSPVSSHKEVADFINSCDCGVFPTRGEGFGLSLLEVLSCAKPLISTFVTAHASYLDDSIANEIATDGLEVANDGRFFRGNGMWYKPNMESLVENMKEAFRRNEKQNPEGRVRAKEYSWTESAKKLVRVAKKYS